jgi:DNA anti-recombination protein RmuC
VAEIDQIERELSTLRQKFAQSAKVLDELSEVQTQFTQLSQAHQDLPGQSAGLEEQVSQLESQLETSAQQLQSQITNLHFEFDAIIRQLREEISYSQQGHQEPNSDSSGLQPLKDSHEYLLNSLHAYSANLEKLERRCHSLEDTVGVMKLVVLIGFVLFAYLQISLR